MTHEQLAKGSEQVLWLGLYDTALWQAPRKGSSSGRADANLEWPNEITFLSHSVVTTHHYRVDALLVLQDSQSEEPSRFGTVAGVPDVA